MFACGVDGAVGIGEERAFRGEERIMEVGGKRFESMRLTMSARRTPSCSSRIRLLEGELLAGVR